jgi:hypothetical protein
MPNADALSLEPMAINAGLWTRAWLGENRHFAADHVNRLILSGYGHQYIVTSLFDGLSVAPLFWEPTLTREGLEVIRQGRIDYILSDLRLTKTLPLLGSLYERGDFPEGKPTTPEPSALLKYDAIPTVNRVFDNGSIVIYDVRRLRDGR